MSTPIPTPTPQPANQSIINTVSNNLFLKAIQEQQAMIDAGNNQGPDHPAILVIGPSGTGKSASYRKLPPDQTVIINPEGKPLPFKDAGKFKANFRNFDKWKAAPYKGVEYYLDVAASEPSIKYIVLDSFTKYGEMLYNTARQIKQGWDIQNLNNDTIYELLERIKKIKDKFVIVTGIDEIVADATVTGSTVRNRRLAVSGKKWEGKIEKEFTIVLFSEARPVMGKAGEFEYKFVTNTDGTISAKSPEGMFPRVIDNDLAYVCKTASEYYQLK